VLRARAIRELQRMDRFGRLHFYYPTNQGLTNGDYIKVHSKVCVVDDRFLRIGSANLCNRSMGLDTECDLAIDLAAPHPAISHFRDRLVAEHLGTSPEHIAHLIEKTGSLRRAIQ